MNRYCGEHLQIGSPEDEDNKDSNDDDKLEEEWGVEEPKAEARLSHIDSYHKITNLKILKVAPKEENRTLTSSKAPATEVKFAKILDKPARVFSQVSLGTFFINFTSHLILSKQVVVGIFSKSLYIPRILTFNSFR